MNNERIYRALINLLVDMTARSTLETFEIITNVHISFKKGDRDWSDVQGRIVLQIGHHIVEAIDLRYVWLDKCILSVDNENFKYIIPIKFMFVDYVNNILSSNFSRCRDLLIPYIHTEWKVEAQDIMSISDVELIATYARVRYNGVVQSYEHRVIAAE